jgi:hypothetical protein
MVLLPHWFVAVKVTLYVPGVLYVTAGFVAVLVAGDPPGKDQEYVVG